MNRTNEDCICARKHGYGCEALVEESDGCMDGTCPFFRNEYDFKVSEAKARKRCEDLGFHFKSRDEVLDEMSYKAKYDKRRKSNMRSPRGIIKYNTYRNEYVEYDSVESCIRSEGIQRQKLEMLLHTGDEWNGYRFVEV